MKHIIYGNSLAAAALVMEFLDRGCDVEWHLSTLQRSSLRPQRISHGQLEQLRSYLFKYNSLDAHEYLSIKAIRGWGDPFRDRGPLPLLSRRNLEYWVDSQKLFEALVAAVKNRGTATLKIQSILDPPGFLLHTLHYFFVDPYETRHWDLPWKQAMSRRLQSNRWEVLELYLLKGRVNDLNLNKKWAYFTKRSDVWMYLEPLADRGYCLSLHSQNPQVLERMHLELAHFERQALLQETFPLPVSWKLLFAMNPQAQQNRYSYYEGPSFLSAQQSYFFGKSLGYYPSYLGLTEAKELSQLQRFLRVWDECEDLEWENQHEMLKKWQQREQNKFSFDLKMARWMRGLGCVPQLLSIYTQAAHWIPSPLRHLLNTPL